MASFDEAVPPGQAGKIQASIRTDHLHGAVAKGINVQTNDPVRPTVRLVLRAEVVGSVRLLPAPTVNLHFRRDAPLEAGLLIRKEPNEAGELAIEDIRPSVPWIDVEARRVTRPEPAAGRIPPAIPGDWVLTVRLAPEAAEGRFSESISLRTGLELEPEVRVPVIGYVSPAINVAPAELVLPAPAPGGQVAGRVNVTVRPDLDPTGLQVDAEPASLHAELQPRGERHFEVAVSWDAAGESTGTAGAVVLTLGANHRRIPVRIGPAPAARPARR